MSNIKKVNTNNETRVELHDALSLTGAEISINTLPAGGSVPFVHYHYNNEEVYGVINGSGKIIIDGEELKLTTGDWLKVTPASKRQLFAAENSSITYVCVQVKENSLDTFTMNDAAVVE